MTVSELIKQLQSWPAGYEILINDKSTDQSFPVDEIIVRPHNQTIEIVSK